LEYLDCIVVAEISDDSLTFAIYQNCILDLNESYWMLYVIGLSRRGRWTRYEGRGRTTGMESKHFNIFKFAV